MNAQPRSSHRRPYVSDEQKWRAVEDRSQQADGHFVFAVKTTGVYCRPSCASRRPRRENVSFHATCADAERDGFRPCKRCQPGGLSLEAGHAATVARACRILETREPAPNLGSLARAVGMSPAHFHRVFRKVAGVSPKSYARAHRAASLRHKLRGSARVTEALYAAGYPSGGRFYAEAARTLGMKPKTFQGGGTGEIIRFAIGESSLGLVLAAATAKGVCAVSLGDDAQALARDLRRQFPKAELIPGDRDFEQTLAAVLALVEHPRAGANLPLDIRGTLFQQKVWRALTNIAPGQTTSYSGIAHRIGQPGAARAVGAACATNKLAVIIPCHRAVRTDGALSGYRWGLTRKRALLQREQAR